MLQTPSRAPAEHCARAGSRCAADRAATRADLRLAGREMAGRGLLSFASAIPLAMLTEWLTNTLPRVDRVPGRPAADRPAGR
jgi:hypothetical protein